jgi:hypothetical protein
MVWDEMMTVWQEGGVPQLGGDEALHGQSGEQEPKALVHRRTRRQRAGSEERAAHTSCVPPALAVDAVHRIPAGSSTVVLAEEPKTAAMEAP